VPRVEQLAHHGGTDESGRSSHEYAHGQASYRMFVIDWRLTRVRCQSLPSL
jgi:hypothetical protein